VTIYHRVLIGERCLVHSGTVIGADGFGYAQDPTQNQGQWVRIPQLGSVRIGDRVEIGANCTIDRGALDDTVIGDGVIIDNLVHIAHNVHLGENVAIAGCSAIAGSTTLGKGVTLAGRSNVLGHLTIAEGAHVTACTLITHSIDKPGVYSSGTVQQENREWRKNAVRFTQLDEMARRLRALEKLLEQTQQEKKT
jgi:UDP-3-O-[3-hydroxymyristoyl] glucosamine N-acyltransferase